MTITQTKKQLVNIIMLLESEKYELDASNENLRKMHVRMYNNYINEKTRAQAAEKKVEELEERQGKMTDDGGVYNHASKMLQEQDAKIAELEKELADAKQAVADWKHIAEQATTELSKGLTNPVDLFINMKKVSSYRNGVKVFPLSENMPDAECANVKEERNCGTCSKRGKWAAVLLCSECSEANGYKDWSK
jgi:DNA repair exonuclease SbcCD ATPase subunit